TVHGSYFEQYTNFVVKRLPWNFFLVKIFFFFWRWYFFFLEKIAIKNVDRYIFITKHLQLYYSSIFDVKKRLGTVIYNGIKKENEVSDLKEKDRKKLSAIIIGSNFYLKGLDIALNSIEKINSSNSVKKKIQLNIIGFDDFYKFISKKKVPNFVNYIGRVNSDQVSAWIQKSDFLLFPSRHEGFPLSILEAIQLKIPVIVSEACKFEEIPNSEKIGIAVQGYKIKNWEDNVIILTKKILFFQKNLEGLNMKPFFWEKIAEEYLHVFNEEN
ncbi:glycosyltransferase, partial [bacterium]|nr:glycosyltransferase [bacterium]